MPARDDEGTVAYQNFKGIDNLTASERLGEDVLRDAINVLFDRSGMIHRRSGYEKVHDARCRSLKSFHNQLVFAEAATLRMTADDFESIHTLFTGLHPINDVAYAVINDKLIFCDGVENRVYDGYSGAVYDLSLITPGAPTVTATQGYDPDGVRAQMVSVAIALVDMQGIEYGLSDITTVDGSNVTVHNLPQSSKIHHVNVYSTRPEGAVLYLAGSVTSPSFSFDARLVDGKTATTKFYQPFPICSKLAYSSGRLFGVLGNFVVFSEPFHYGVHQPDTNFFAYPSPVKMIAGLESGVFVVADKTYWISGSGTDEVKQDVVLPISAPDQVPAEVMMRHFGDSEGIGVVWISDRGFELGSNGQVTSLTESMIKLPKYSKSAIVFREDNGVKQVVATAPPNGTHQTAVVQDSWDVEIRRNVLTEP